MRAMLVLIIFAAVGFLTQSSITTALHPLPGTLPISLTVNPSRTFYQYHLSLDITWLLLLRPPLLTWGGASSWTPERISDP